MHQLCLLSTQQCLEPLHHSTSKTMDLELVLNASLPGALNDYCLGRITSAPGRETQILYSLASYPAAETLCQGCGGHKIACVNLAANQHELA